MKKRLHIFIPFLIVLLLDVLTKVWAEKALSSPIPILGNFFRLTLGYNSGVAFGLFANGGIGPLVVTGIIIVGIVIWLVKMMLSDELPLIVTWPIGLIIGGAIGNFVDRLPDGRVTDFVDFGWGLTRWPTFNLANSFIVVGCLLLLLIIPKINSIEKEQTA